MTDSESPTKAASAEPSMEDILASIRRILSEDTPETAEGAKPATPAPATATTAPPPPGSSADDEHELDIEDAFPDIDEPDAPPTPEATAVAPRQWSEPMTTASRHHEEVFVLTASMRAPVERPLLSTPSTDAATDVLSQLAKAILDRRDIAVGARDVTLEDMVRTMLRPMLQEWLDRNLPYLIERLVKKEIDLMINRAERLD